MDRYKSMALFTAAVMSLGSLCHARENIVTDTLGVISAGSANVTELLRSRLSGVRVSAIDGNPAGGENIHIRGLNSLRTDNQPLWVVDGTMLSTDLRENLDAFWQYGEQSYTSPLNPVAFLNAYDIESIEVLKDAAATAIWGTRGANGVIIVKTRRPVRTDNAFTWHSDLGYAGGFSHNHRGSFSGAIDNTSYNLSLAYRSVDGSIPGNGCDYATFRGNFETRANNTVWFGFNSLLSGGKSSSPAGVTYLGLASRTLAMRDAFLSPGTSKQDWDDDYDDDTEDYRGVISSYLQFNISPLLYLKFDVGMDLQSNYRTIWYGTRTPFGRPSADNVNGGAAANLVSFLASYNAGGELNFNKYFAVHHRMALRAGVQYLGNNNKFNTLNGINFTSSELRGNGLRTGAYEIRNHKFTRSYKHLGAYVDMDYDYKGFIGLDGVLRADRTPKYHSEGNNIFPAATLWADLHKALFPGGRMVSALRLKSGYGISGYEKYVPYELFGNYLSSAWPEPESGTSTFFDGLDMLRTRELTVSAEMSLFEDRRVNLSLVFFDRTTDDSFLMYQLGRPSASRPSVWVWGGCEEVFSRKSAVRNQGLEADFNARLLQSGGWKLSVDCNLTICANEVTSSNSEDFLGRVVGHGIYCTCNALGLPVSSLYGYKADASGQYVDMTGEGRIDEADKVILGKTIPKYYGGLGVTVDKDALSVFVLFEGVGGHKIADVNSIVSDGVTGPDGLVCLSSRYVHRGDYARLTRAGVRYRLPDKIWKFKEASITLSGHNLLTLTSYPGWNPDVNCFGASTLTNGLDYGSFPMKRMFVIGLDARF